MGADLRPAPLTAGSAPSSSAASPRRRRSSSTRRRLDDERARAKRPLTPQMLPFLPRGILESAALAPYLERWRLDAAAAATRARCAYPTLD